MTDNTEIEENHWEMENGIPIYRNPVWDNLEHSSFSVDIKHSEFGWIRCSTSSEDNGVAKPLWDTRENLEIQEFVPVQETLEQLQLNRYHLLDRQIEEYLDARVKEHNYKSVESCVSYYNSTDDKYRAEARAVSTWRDHVYRTGEQVWQSVLNGLVDYKDVDLAYIINIAGDFSWETNV